MAFRRSDGFKRRFDAFRVIHFQCAVDFVGAYVVEEAVNRLLTLTLTLTLDSDFDFDTDC